MRTLRYKVLNTQWTPLESRNKQPVSKRRAMKCVKESTEKEFINSVRQIAGGLRMKYSGQTSIIILQ